VRAKGFRVNSDPLYYATIRRSLCVTVCPCFRTGDLREGIEIRHPSVAVVCGLSQNRTEILKNLLPDYTRLEKSGSMSEKKTVPGANGTISLPV